MFQILTICFFAEANRRFFISLYEQKKKMATKKMFFCDTKKRCFY